MYLDGFVSFVSFCSGCLEEEVTFSQLGPTFSLQLFRVEASECTICLHQLQSACISCSQSVQALGFRNFGLRVRV